MHREVHILQEAKEEFQVSSEEEVEKDIVEEEEMDLEKDKVHSVIIVISLVILKNIVMHNCKI
jgi:hypothetical protein